MLIIPSRRVSGGIWLSRINFDAAFATRQACRTKVNFKTGIERIATKRLVHKIGLSFSAGIERTATKRFLRIAVPITASRNTKNSWPVFNQEDAHTDTDPTDIQQPHGPMKEHAERLAVTQSPRPLVCYGRQRAIALTATHSGGSLSEF